MLMKRWILAVCLTLCWAGIGKAQERDPKSFYLAGDLKLTSVLRAPHILESLLNINICEFDVELPDNKPSLMVTVAESGGQVEDLQADPQGPLKDFYTADFSFKRAESK